MSNRDSVSSKIENYLKGKDWVELDTLITEIGEQPGSDAFRKSIKRAIDNNTLKYRKNVELDNKFTMKKYIKNTELKREVKLIKPYLRKINLNELINKLNPEVSNWSLEIKSSKILATLPGEPNIICEVDILSFLNINKADEQFNKKTTISPKTPFEKTKINISRSFPPIYKYRVNQTEIFYISQIFNIIPFIKLSPPTEHIYPTAYSDKFTEQLIKTLVELINN